MSGENTEKKIYVRPTIRRQFMGHANKFGGLAIPEPVVSIDGVAVADLVREFGSPLFVFSEATLRRKVRELNHAFSSRYPRFQAAISMVPTSSSSASCFTAPRRTPARPARLPLLAA